MSKFDLMGESRIDVMTPLGNLVSMLDDEIKHGRAGASVMVILDGHVVCNLADVKLSEIEPGKFIWMFWVEDGSQSYCAGTLRDELSSHKNAPVAMVRRTYNRGKYGQDAGTKLMSCQMSGEFGNENGILIIRATTGPKFTGIKTYMKQLGNA